MMWWMLTALAAPPEGVDLEDTEPWEQAREDLFNGPDGCWEVVGRASWNYDLGQFAETRGNAVFVGRLDDHVWSELFVKSNGEEYREGKDLPHRIYDDDQKFMPLVGRSKGDEGEGSVALLTTALDELVGDVGLSWLQWDEDSGGAWLESRSPLADSKDKEVSIRTFFPGGTLFPVHAVVTLPERFEYGTFPQRATIRDARVEMRGREVGGRVFPAAEAVTAKLGAYGFAFTFAQTVQYLRFEPCTATPAATPQEKPAEP